MFQVEGAFCMRFLLVNCGSPAREAGTALDGKNLH